METNVNILSSEMIGQKCVNKNQNSSTLIFDVNVVSVVVPDFCSRTVDFLRFPWVETSIANITA